jgi:hypothetical protein
MVDTEGRDDAGAFDGQRRIDGGSDEAGRWLEELQFDPAETPRYASTSGHRGDGLW